MKEKFKMCFFLTINIIIVVSTLHNIYCCIFNPAGGILNPMGLTCFRFYTIDSNLFLSVTSVLTVLAFVCKKDLSHKQFIIRFCSIVTIMITWLTVLVFLGPIFGYKAMYSGDNLYAHFVNPLLGIISFLFMEKGQFNGKEHFKAIIPTIGYGIVYIIMAVILKKWPDFYGFNRNNMMPLTAVIMVTAVTALSVIIKKIYTVLNK